MGTTSAFFALTQNSAYFSHRWSIFLALAPPLSMLDLNLPLLQALCTQPYLNMLGQAFSLLNIQEISRSLIETSPLQYFCQLFPQVCTYVYSYAAGDYNVMTLDDAIAS